MKPYQDKELMKSLYEELGATKRVAERIGCNEKTALIWMRKHGLEVKDPGQNARRNHLNHDYFEIIDTEEKAYWLGFIYADGCIYKGASKDSYRLQINLALKDKGHLDKFQTAISSSYKIQEKEVKNKAFKNGAMVALLKINSTKMCKDLMGHGVVQRKSLILEMPSHLNPELVPHFIRGYFDGDGSINLTKLEHNRELWRIHFVGTKQMLTSITEHLHQNQINMNDVREVRNGIYEAATGAATIVNDFFNYIYNNSSVYLQRKYDKFQDFKLSPLGAILSTKCELIAGKPLEPLLPSCDGNMLSG